MLLQVRDEGVPDELVGIGMGEDPINDRGD